MAPVGSFDTRLGQSANNTIGALLLGSIGAAILFGVTSLQVYWYYHSYYPRDSRIHLYSVGILWGLDILHLIVTIHVVYNYLVTGFGDFSRLGIMVWSFKLQTALTVVIILFVQGLYAYRVWLLGGYHRGVLGYIVTAVVAGGFALGIVLAIETYSVAHFKELDEIAWAIIACLVASTTIDWVIASAMCYYLRKSKGPHSRLNSKISTLMQYTLSSGLFTSACSSSALVSYLLLPHTFVFLGIEALLTQLYINSFLAMLNARRRGSVGKEDEKQVSIHLPTLAKTQKAPSHASSSSSGGDKNSQNDFAANTDVRPARDSGFDDHASPKDRKIPAVYPW